ncbi:MAG: hypothetical protein AABO41_27710 [Acidobacteriota bacterium]
MVKTDRSSAPLGLALLFLSLAIVPVSLKVAGYEVSISPSLSAALEAWRSVAGVLGDNSQAATDTELSLVKKYSFAEDPAAPTQEQAVAETFSKSFEPDSEPDLDSIWEARESASLSVASPAIQVKTCPKTACSSAASNGVATARWKRTIASSSLIRTAVGVEAKKTKCAERQAALLRVHELVHRSRAFSELFRTVELQKNVQVFVRMKPIALFSSPICDPELMPIGEPATEVFRNGGSRFGVGASEEPESFEFWFEF